MHELSIAGAVLETVRAELQGHPQARPCRLGLRVGEWSGVDAEALRFCLEVLATDTELAEMALDIERCPRRNRCPRCGTEFLIVEYEVRCPACGEKDTIISGGAELELAFLELEEA